MENMASGSEVKRGLTDLEHAAIAAHAQIETIEGEIGQLDRKRLPLAMAAGDALIEIINRKLIKHGQRSTLFLRTCGSVRMAQIYITLAEHRELVEANAKRVSHLGINAALRLIRGTRKKPRRPSLVAAFVAAWDKLSGEEKTAALAQVGFDRVWPMLPQHFYPQIKRRVATELFNHAKREKPNMRLRHFKPQLVFDADAQGGRRSFLRGETP